MGTGKRVYYILEKLYLELGQSHTMQAQEEYLHGPEISYVLNHEEPLSTDTLQSEVSKKTNIILIMPAHQVTFFERAAREFYGSAEEMFYGDTKETHAPNGSGLFIFPKTHTIERIPSLPVVSKK